MSSRIIGFVVIGAGVLALIYGGFRFAYPDNVVDVGSVHVSVQRHKTVYVPPILGALAIAGGAVLLAVGQRRA